MIELSKLYNDVLKEISYDEQVVESKKKLLKGYDAFSAKVDAIDFDSHSHVWKNNLLKRTWEDHYDDQYASFDDFFKDAAIWFYISMQECLYIDGLKSDLDSFTKPNKPCPSELDAVERLIKLEDIGKLYDINRFNTKE